MTQIVNFLIGNWGWILLGEVFGFWLFWLFWNFKRRGTSLFESAIDIFVLCFTGAIGLAIVFGAIGLIVGMTLWFSN